MYEDSLPFTGAALTVGGITIGVPIVVSIAVGAILIGIGLYRLATRGRRAQTRD
ncbi:hypothetical protein [Nonomuraea sediminis]|uniref:hypothetical protein n=1 Tax=Nonomuraea sediminis TaxID=2835864 RepID=UPI001BDC7C92|nr:hypothetical protein [Nonomuraea sediminis]